ncbi:MAG: monovalent cation/H(+) antiporter subunit G [Syntrophotalea acetylenica]|uniref:Sodium:proton antiporter n=1 Tax=Syntrophotalea acetylenica TaxID=29542 RepID=A0A1L3GFR2_SYNAC|nr:monovalent cation/H(+) antiporter subunit G [Syntrophotalea acetylenica]APG24757.1 sodium:proton antiporter [Syntrophotalea acetylenica]APG42811.1 sodium:proton antiporter [Syntrophotalea acetylenica]MDD4457741.1 monovalent cation/H(+) antiporter subunit G [Syntrophotalea acetylenica]MDY0261689.1 monovalent cation/H(+) antiporter subunit G [Syntrophotalea acetylenica]
MLWITGFLLVAGIFFFAVGVVGVLRFPDFYTRLHAAGKCDSLAAVLVIAGVALYNLVDFSPANLLVSLKILAIAAFVFVASPTATHAVTEAALIIGMEPWTKKDEPQ